MSPRAKDARSARRAVSDAAEEVRLAALPRLKRIEGQVRGIARMVEEDRYCADVITQIAAAQESLRGVAKALLKNHLRHCASEAIERGGAAAESMYDELLDLMAKMAR